MSDPAALKAIQQRMAQVRHDLGDEVGELVESAKDMTDWRQYVRANPWICMAAAAAIGFLAVPKRAPIARLSPADLKALARQGHLVASASSANGGLRRAVLSFLATAALRAITGYLGQRVAKATVEPLQNAHHPF